MRADGPYSNPIVYAVAIFLAVTIAARAQSFSLYSVSNALPTNALETSDIEADVTRLPLVEMKDVPLSEGIKRLAKQANIKFSYDSHLKDWWAITDDVGRRIHEPLLNFHWTNISARDAFCRVLRDNDLVITQNQLTGDSQITMIDGDAMSNDLGIYANSSNTIPLIEFEDVPITVALENLARQANMNFLFDPYVAYGKLNRYGQVITEPTITFRRTNITAELAFNSICHHHHFTIVNDTNTGVSLVRYRGHDIHFVKMDFNPGDTNVIPSIQFADVPLSWALKNLARQARVKCILSARIDTAEGLQVSLHWQNLTATQAFATICESYDLDIVTYDGTSIIRVEPDY